MTDVLILIQYRERQTVSKLASNVPHERRARPRLIVALYRPCARSMRMLDVMRHPETYGAAIPRCARYARRLASPK